VSIRSDASHSNLLDPTGGRDETDRNRQSDLGAGGRGFKSPRLGGEFALTVRTMSADTCECGEFASGPASLKTAEEVVPDLREQRLR
jgi:hypothetical protein